MAQRKKSGYWMDFQNVERELRDVIERIGHFPTQKELTKEGYSGMIDAISNYYSGLNKVRKRLGYECEIVEFGKWKDLKFTLRQARIVMHEIGSKILPSKNELCGKGYHGLSNAVSIYHGGFKNFRRLLGEKDKNERYNDRDFVLNEARRVIRKHGYDTLPCSNKLKELGYVTLAVAIDKKHGGYQKFRKKLGEKQKKIPNGKLTDRDYVIKQIRKVMKKRKCDSTPSSTQLNKWGYKSLSYAINSYHGGFRSFRQLLGEGQRRVESGTWKSLEYTLEKAKGLLSENNLEKLPGHERLIKFKGGPSLSRAIMKYHGGYISFREKLYQDSLGISSNHQLEALLEGYAETTKQGTG